MDIAAMSMVISQYKAQESAGILIMKKVMDRAGQEGDAIVEMLSAGERAIPADPYLGNNIDRYV
ncbi:MAG: YjfB family protein [Bacillota bacterium]